MTKSPLHKFFVLDNEILPVEYFRSEEGKQSIYEVLRVIGGVPLFIEDHLLRFRHSAELAGIEMMNTVGDISSVIDRLIERNGNAVGNIMIVYSDRLMAYYIPHSYPTSEMYLRGVICSLLNSERHNPNAKVLHTETRKLANHLILEKGFFEVLLVDHYGNITEGSRSNVFFVKGEKLITAPLKTVLPGITRQKVIQLACDLNIEVEERNIRTDELGNYEAVFITGTSPKILPVNQIDEHFFDSENKITGLISDAYNTLIARYVRNYKSV